MSEKAAAGRTEGGPSAKLANRTAEPVRLFEDTVRRLRAERGDHRFNTYPVKSILCCASNCAAISSTLLAWAFSKSHAR